MIIEKGFKFSTIERSSLLFVSNVSDVFIPSPMLYFTEQTIQTIIKKFNEIKYGNISSLCNCTHYT